MISNFNSIKYCHTILLLLFTFSTLMTLYGKRVCTFKWNPITFVSGYKINRKNYSQLIKPKYCVAYKHAILLNMYRMHDCTTFCYKNIVKSIWILHKFYIMKLDNCFIWSFNNRNKNNKYKKKKNHNLDILYIFNAPYIDGKLQYIIKISKIIISLFSISDLKCYVIQINHVI